MQQQHLTLSFKLLTRTLVPVPCLVYDPLITALLPTQILQHTVHYWQLPIGVAILFNLF
jgi:hypothetical protein